MQFETIFSILYIQNLLKVSLAGGSLTKVVLTLDAKWYYK